MLRRVLAGFCHFWPIFGPFLAFFAILGPGGPQIFGEESRFDARMVRYWSHVVSKVNWRRFGDGLEASFGDF